MRRPRVRSLLIVLCLVVSLVSPLVGAAQEAATPVPGSGAPVILAAVTGWDPAAAQAAADDTAPALRALLETGSHGDMLSPGGVGPALATLLTGAWPAEHGVVSDTFFRTGSPDFAEIATWGDPGVGQADTLPLAAERAGKQVAAVGWPAPGAGSGVLQGPVIGPAETFSGSGVVRIAPSEDEVAAATAGGVDLAELTFGPATEWAGAPTSFSDPQEAVFTVDTTDASLNPERTIYVLAVDSTDDGATNYDEILVANARDAATATPVAAGSWGSVPLELSGPLAGASASLSFKVLDLAPDLSALSLYFAPVSRLAASWAGCDGVDACLTDGGFVESVNQRLGPAQVRDDAAFQGGLIDETTFAEQSAAVTAQSQAAVTYLVDELGVYSDLLLLGAAVAPVTTGASAGATPVAAPATGGPGQDYLAVDGLLAAAGEALGGHANIVLAAPGADAVTTHTVDAGAVLVAAGLAEAVQPGNCVPAPVGVPAGTPDPEALPVGPQVKACWDGQVAHIYVNLDGREAAGSVADDALGALQDELVAAFSAVQDPNAPDAAVVANVFRKEEARNVDGIDLLHPSRTGDVVVILNAPYRFGSHSRGDIVAEATAAAAAPAAANGALYLAGPSLAAGADISAPATDVAPTVAMLLDVPGPHNASGNLLLAALPEAASLRDITILDISDFHGQLPPLTASADSLDAEGAVGSSYPVGGIAALDQWFDLYRDRAHGPVLLVAAGDSVGATPPISTAFGDRPTIEFMNALGFSADALGNHNFDAGADYMFATLAPLADYPFLSVNLVLARGDATPVSGEAPFQPSLLLEVDGATIGLIGFSNPDIPTLTRPGALDPYRVIDPVQPITDEAASLRGQGAMAVVAMGHMGALSGTLTEPSGPVVDVADAVAGVDVVIGDHTDVQVSATRPNGVLLTENRSKGVMFTRVNLIVNVVTGELVYVTTDFHRPWVIGMTPDPEIEAQLEALEAELAPTLGQVIGAGALPIPRSDACGMETGRTCESLIGNVITDAMRTSYNTDFALTNSGGIRASLTCPAEGGDFCPDDRGENQITTGQVLSVLPFGNVAVTVEITGAELKEMLETGVSAMPEASGAFPQVSGLCFTYDISQQPGQRVTGAVRQGADGSCTGEAIDLGESATYALATNDFTASGGDGYPDLLARSNSRDVLANVVVDSISETSALALPGEALNPQIQGRIVCQGEGCPALLP